ncbi:hypothetical protein C2L64_47715 [Paraburkholderia hospita]|uniref:DUF3331 domain-containing protein n=2 Tax=Paraburkholderia hospita TaxID=169430 RepID=A0AAN1MQM4_9BURK|nr:hypothetical protein C2L64_47715 [Paraburkholderia hospita]
MYSSDNVGGSQAWHRTLEMLSSGGDDRHDRVRSIITAEPNTSSAYRAGNKVQVRILERPTNSTLIVLWSDPGRCFYGHQSWRATKARLAGRCAFSHSVIREGDEVYRPAYTSVEPQNSQAMILASVVYGTVGRHAE